jgi:hypothetical protein
LDQHALVSAIAPAQTGPSTQWCLDRDVGDVGTYSIMSAADEIESVLMAGHEDLLAAARGPGCALADPRVVRRLSPAGRHP